MSTRSPHNARYKKDTAPKGTTRKSAASAKPVRRKGGKPASVKAASSKAVPIKYQMPDTDEYKQLRKQWWIVLGVAIVILAISLVLTIKPLDSLLGANTQLISLAISWIALGLVGYAWYIDLRKIRPMVRAYQASLRDKK